MTHFKEFIENLASSKAPGPSMTFDASHIFFALELIAAKPIGRNQLARKLGVGAGTVRTIVSRLKDNNLIRVSRKGCNLTDNGWVIWKKFEQLFPRRDEIGRTELTNAAYNYAFLVKNKGRNVRTGIEQRDAAIVTGAAGAVIIVSKQGHLTIESVSNRLERQFPEAALVLQKTFNPEENDVIVLVGATSSPKALHGAFAASWTLIGRDEQLLLNQ